MSSSKFLSRASSFLFFIPKHFHLFSVFITRWNNGSKQIVQEDVIVAFLNCLKLKHLRLSFYEKQNKFCLYLDFSWKCHLNRFFSSFSWIFKALKMTLNICFTDLLFINAWVIIYTTCLINIHQFLIGSVKCCNFLWECLEKSISSKTQVTVQIISCFSCSAIRKWRSRRKQTTWTKGCPRTNSTETQGIRASGLHQKSERNWGPHSASPTREFTANRNTNNAEKEIYSTGTSSLFGDKELVVLDSRC